MILSLVSLSLLKSLLGVISFAGIGVFFSTNYKKIEWLSQLKMLAVLLFMALFLLKVPCGVVCVEYIASFFASLYMAAEKGIYFLFGELSNAGGPWGFVFLFKVIPVIIFFSALISILNYLGIIQAAVSAVGKVLAPLLGTRRAETLCAVANSFLGQTEAPILIKDYLPTMSDSEIFAIMVAGMGTISGGLIAVYGVLGVPIKHLLVSSILSIPATLFIAKLWVPYEGDPHKEQVLKIDKKSEAKAPVNILDAIGQGTGEGLMLALNIAAILLVTISLLGLVDLFLGFISDSILYLYEMSTGKIVIGEVLSLRKIFGVLGIPAAWLIGISKEGLLSAASLIGTKVAVNEMVAYSNLLLYAFNPRDLVLLVYALCGFSNFSCIGIQIGGISVLAPNKRATISIYGVRAVFAAACSNLLIACIVNMII